MLTVERVDYVVNWKAFKKGSSFFIPCLNCRAARDGIAVVVRRFRFKAIRKVTIEDGVRGLRVWRV